MIFFVRSLPLFSKNPKTDIGFLDGSCSKNPLKYPYTPSPMSLMYSAADPTSGAVLALVSVVTLNTSVLPVVPVRSLTGLL